jgi:hypothetical protein
MRTQPKTVAWRLAVDAVTVTPAEEPPKDDSNSASAAESSGNDVVSAPVLRRDRKKSIKLIEKGSVSAITLRRTQNDSRENRHFQRHLWHIYFSRHKKAAQKGRLWQEI